MPPKKKKVEKKAVTEDNRLIIGLDYGTTFTGKQPQ
jgi:hypothetical protein